MNKFNSFFLGSICGIWGFAATSTASALPAVNDDIDKAATEYFAKSLKGSNKQFDESQPIATTDIESMRKRVWEAWKTANNNFDEQKLFKLMPFEDHLSGSWTLPSSLEPNATMPYYWGYKGSNKPEEGYPLFVFLHGSGDKTQEWSNAYSWSSIFNDKPSAYFVPQIPNTGAYYRWWQKSKQYAWEKLLRLSFVTGDINPNRVYFFGVSEGGYGSQRLASFYADYFAAVGPMAGGEPLRNAPAENLRHVAYFMRTGQYDTSFGRNRMTNYTREALDSLAKVYPGDYVHSVSLVPGAGHGLDYSPSAPWMKQYTRNPHPKHINWENYAMDGIYRNGFYNIYVLKRTRGTAPMYIQMDIENNVVNVSVKQTFYKTTYTESGIEMKFDKTYRYANNGKLRIYLSPELVDLDSDVTININGRKAFKGKATPDVKNMINSCAEFFDPYRIYPSAVDIDISNVYTGISTVTTTANKPSGNKDVVYNLNGQRVENPSNGIFITGDGEKFYAK